MAGIALEWRRYYRLPRPQRRPRPYRFRGFLSKGNIMSTAPMHALPADTKIQNYRILKVLGEGGFGITYLAHDEVLDQKVAIKEYYPVSLTGRDQNTHAVHVLQEDAAEIFQWGLERFLSEARILAKLSHPNIVRVLYFTSLNNTGYMVMQYEEGQPLNKWVKRFPGGRMPQDDIVALLDPITQALDVVHELGIAHRDVKPANIYIRSNGEPVLLDFGAARDIVGGRSQTMAAIVSVGYSPLEQYSDVAKQGPWTDIYATAAVVYRLITGETPPDAPSRIDAMTGASQDPCRKLSADPPAGFSKQFLAGIDKALALRASDRPQSIGEWRGLLGFDADEASEAMTETIIVNDDTVIIRDDAPAAGASRRPGRSSSGMAIAGAGLAVMAGAGFIAYQQYFTGPPDAFGSTFETGKKIGALSGTARTVAEDIGGSDARDVVRFDVGAPSIVDVGLESVPQGVKLELSDANGRVFRPLQDDGKSRFKLSDGEYALTISSKNDEHTPYRVALKAEGTTGGDGDRTVVDLSRIGVGARKKLGGVLWSKSEEHDFEIDVREKAKLRAELQAGDNKGALTLVDKQGLSVGKLDGGEGEITALLDPGQYKFVATSRQDDPFSFSLEIANLELPAPPPSTARSAQVSMQVDPGRSREQAVIAIRNQARAKLITGEDGAAGGAAWDMKALEEGLPFDEVWLIKWTDETTLSADLRAQVRPIDKPGAFGSELSATVVEELKPFDVSIVSRDPDNLNLGIYAWGADDSVVRIFPIGGKPDPISLSEGGSVRLSDKVEKLVSAPLPGEKESLEAVVVVGCSSPEDFVKLAPAAGVDVEMTMAKAITFQKFSKSLSEFCPSSLSLKVLPYTVVGK